MFQTPSATNGTNQRFNWFHVTILLGGMLLLYYVVPLVSLLTTQPPGLVLSRMATPAIIAAATTSVTASTISTGIATVLGVPLAYWLAHAPRRTKTLGTALVILPLVLPPVVSGMVLLTIVGPGTVLGELTRTAGIPLTRSMAGIVLAQTFVASPFVVITAKAAFENINPTYAYASRSLGKSQTATFRDITLPLAWPGILAGITLAFGRAIGEFGATIMLAYYPRTMPVEIWVSYTTLGLDTAFPVAIILLGIAIITLLILSSLGTNPFE